MTDKKRKRHSPIIRDALTWVSLIAHELNRSVDLGVYHENSDQRAQVKYQLLEVLHLIDEIDSLQLADTEYTPRSKK